MYKRISTPITGIDFVKSIIAGTAAATGGESPYSVNPEFYTLLSEAADGGSTVEVTLHPDSTFQVSAGVYVDTDPQSTNVGRSTTLGNFAVKLQAGNVISNFNVDFGTVLAFANGNGKTVIRPIYVPAKTGQEAPKYSRGALAGKRLLNVTPEHNKVIDIEQDGKIVLQYLEKVTTPVPAP